MCVYLIETKAVHFSAFPALFYLTLVLSAILIRSTTWIYGGDRVYADSKHVFWFTSLLVPRIAKSWAGGWERGNAFVWAHRWVVLRFCAGLMRPVSCFMGLVSYSTMKLISDSISGCAGGYKTLWSSIPTNSFNIIGYAIWCTLLI